MIIVCHLREWYCKDETYGLILGIADGEYSTQLLGCEGALHLELKLGEKVQNGKVYALFAGLFKPNDNDTFYEELKAKELDVKSIREYR